MNEGIIPSRRPLVMFPSTFLRTTLPFVATICMSIQSPCYAKLTENRTKLRNILTPRGSSMMMDGSCRQIERVPCAFHHALVPAVRLPRSGHSVPPRLERARFRFHATCDTPERHASKAAENEKAHASWGVRFSRSRLVPPARRADPSIPRHLAETHRSHGIRAPDGRRRRQAQGGYPRGAHLGLFAWGEKRERGDESAARVRASSFDKPDAKRSDKGEKDQRGPKKKRMRRVLRARLLSARPGPRRCVFARALKISETAAIGPDRPDAKPGLGFVFLLGSRGGVGKKTAASRPPRC